MNKRLQSKYMQSKAQSQRSAYDYCDDWQTGRREFHFANCSIWLKLLHKPSAHLQ